MVNTIEIMLYVGFQNVADGRICVSSLGGGGNFQL